LQQQETPCRRRTPQTVAPVAEKFDPCATILRAVQLYLVRHAEAASGEPDELRPLTPEGRAAARELGRRLASEGIHPDAVLTSPLLRARETAAELARPAGLEPEPDDRLAPGASADDVRTAAGERGRTIVLVAHQPDCGRIAAVLTGGAEPAFPPAGMVAIDLPE
jgi:phosphohistidine phosphatase